jgi:hypothetical protein
MKYHVKQFKSLAAALKEIEPFVRNVQHLQTGKPFEKFGGMRSRDSGEFHVLCLKSALRLEWRDQEGQDEAEERDHRRRR